ncbi:PHP domain-containing protein [Butyricicoccus sp. AM05-1]|uniref:PHP domain-containing protein n=1 Tax=Butyricicoccus sp. AM05-1 TaxID=2292004 RepID=UPI0024309D30|nr:PHP domain-containing protein [Butyricicoccus sp. AM05-1]
MFQNYHKHTTYSNPRVSDSVVTYEDYAKRAVELGHSILSSCEHGWQGRYIECYDLAKQYGLKFLFAAEAYWVWDRHEEDRSNCHIWVGAKNENGREWINEVLSQANEDGFYYQPRLDEELLDLLPAGDVWITTACVAGWKYLGEEEERLKALWKKLYDKHGDNFMFEVQYHPSERQKELNRYILNLRKEIPAPIIMGCDSHYIEENGAELRSDFLLSKEDRKAYDDEEEWFMDYPDGDTAVRRFREQGVLTEAEITEAIDRTNCFLEVEEYECDIFDDSLKLFSLHPDWTQEQKNAEYLRLVDEGWQNYKAEVATDLLSKYEKEIKSETDTVVECHMADYFIDNYHVIRRGKELGGHLTNTGRGSAVSFFTNKLLGFTEVDRIAAKVKMYPERFMTATRILETHSLPDIDFNVAEQDIFAEGQAQVCGRDHAVQMLAYGTQKASAAWKMFAKSQNIDFATANEVSAQIKRYENKLHTVDEEEKDTIDIMDYIDKRFHDVYLRSTEYQGIITSWSPAPCAFLLYQGSIRRKIGLVKIKDRICCAMDGHWAEKNHFLKNDLLRVAVVDLINKGYTRAGLKVPTVNELLAMCPSEDPVWDIYRKGCTLGINQVEQPGTASRVGVYAPTNISELCAFIAAIRPGFKSMYKIFESRQDFSYDVKPFDDLLRTEELPQSFCLYQEQQMAVLNYAGFPMSECYAAIKNIAKKRKEKVLAYHERFINAFSKRLVEQENINKTDAAEKAKNVWKIIEDAAQYAFNSSHSYSVSLDSLYGAWLKQHHPLAFYETFMRIMDEKGDKDKLAAAKDEAESYFNIKFPPFKFGQDNRKVTADEENNAISNALTSIKGFNKAAAVALYELGQEPPKYLSDVLLALRPKSIMKSTTEPLAQISYFSSYGNDREVLNIIALCEEFGYGAKASMPRERVDNSFLADIVPKYADGLKKDGQPATRYTFTSLQMSTLKDEKKRLAAALKKNPTPELEEQLLAVEQEIAEELKRIVAQVLRECEDRVLAAGIEDLPFRVKIENQQEILGYVDIRTGKEEDRRLVLVSDFRPLLSKDTGKPWGYACFTQSLGSGKRIRLTLRSRQYDQNPIKNGSIIYVDRCTKNKSGYWYLDQYHLVG